MRRVKRESFGIVRRIPPHRGGALAQCTFCEWGRFFEDSKRKRYSAVARGAASLRAHARLVHPDKLLKITTAEEFLK